MLKIKNITKNFGGIKALDNVSFELKQGKINALIGPNGSGKTTLFNVISNIIKKDKGQVYLGKENISNLSDFNVAKKGISRTFQEVYLFRNLTIKENIEIAMSKNDEKLFKSFFSKENDFSKKIIKVLELVGLEKSTNALAGDLSYGQRKLLSLAISLSLPHKVLLLDEPVAGVNPNLRHQIKNIIKKLNKKGETIFIIEHDMNFIMDLAHHIFVMDEGKLLVEGKPEKIQNDKRVLEAYLGE